MSQRKVYQSTTYQYLDTYVLVNGQKVLIQFRGGSLSPRINGKYATEDPDVIATLDADLKRLGPNAPFKCIHESEIPDAKKKEAAPKAKADNAPQNNPEGLEEDGEGGNPGPVIEIPGIKTVQEAKNYLITNFPDDVKMSMLPNGTKVKEVAASKNIKFIDLA